MELILFSHSPIEHILAVRVREPLIIPRRLVTGRGECFQ
jgi:hypothetical protein